MTQRLAKRDVLTLRTAGDRACRRPERRPWLRARWRVGAAAKNCASRSGSTQHNLARRDRRILYTRSLTRRPAEVFAGKRIWRYTTLPPRLSTPPSRQPTKRHRRAQALAKLQATRASLTDYAVELDKSADAKTGYKAKYADGKDYVLATYARTCVELNQ